ncbi:ankyrin 1 [Fusarium beomiforme]|uniref:Ankyrin 1 n=1 Tax=Fusarium beomiforme TaxID=44412 RepID=A0A9P5ASP5_9HYPO|nr:ankyrin 1 [Fusarium beomiforme]
MSDGSSSLLKSQLSILHAAAEGGHQEIIVLFLERRYRFQYEPPGPMYMRAFPSSYRPLYRKASPGRDKHPRNKLLPRLDKWRYKRNENIVKSNTDDKVTRVETDSAIELFDVESSEVGQGNLLQNNRDVYGSSRKNRPLEASAARGRDAVVKVLLEQAETLGIKSFEVSDALKAASSNGHTTTVKLLLDHASMMEGPFIEHIYAVFQNLPEEHHDILQFTFAKASESGFTEEEVDALRLKLPPGKEKYKAEVVDSNTLKTDFLLCCRSGNLTVLEAILSCKHQHQLQPSDLLEGLHLAAEKGHASFLKSLLEHRDDLKGATIPKKTLVAAAGKDLETLKVLLSQRNNWTHFPSILGRLTFAACSKGQSDIIKYLVSDFGVDVNAEVPQGEKPRWRWHRTQSLHAPTISVPTNATDETTRGVALSAFDSYEIPYWAGSFTEKTMPKQENVVKTLLKLGADPNSLGGRDDYPLQYAAMLCPDAVVKELLEAGAKIRLIGQGDSALMRAAQRETEALRVVTRLLGSGHPLPEYPEGGKEILDVVLSFFEGNREQHTFYSIIEDPDGRFLREPTLEQIGRQQIWPGSADGLLPRQSVFVELLLAGGVDVDVTGYYYGSSMQAAARTGQIEIIKALLDKGANPNVIQGRWHTPLRASIVTGSFEVVKLMLQHGADPKLKYQTKRGSTRNVDRASSITLQLALKEGHINIAKLLLEMDPSLIDEEGYLQPPLIISCQNGEYTMEAISNLSKCFCPKALIST